MKITLQQLKDLDACSEQVERFSNQFGAEVEVTEELCMHYARKFDWDWAAEHLLSASALAKYERVVTRARIEYERVRALAWTKYKCAITPARVEYECIETQALIEYKRVRALAWARAYNLQA